MKDKIVIGTCLIFVFVAGVVAGSFAWSSASRLAVLEANQATITQNLDQKILPSITKELNELKTAMGSKPKKKDGG